MFLKNNVWDLKYKFESTLFKYIKESFGVDYSDYVYYSDVFTDGMYTCRKLRKGCFKDCIIIQGYPHFEVPEEFLVAEIFDFLDRERVLESEPITFFGGDTHIDKPIPRIAQLRGFILSSALTNMFKSIGVDSSFVYVIGDVGKRVEDYIFQEYGISILDKKYMEIVERTTLESRKIIKEKIREIGFNQEAFIFMSDIINYSRKYIDKNFKLDRKIFREDGSLRYLGQELSLIFYINKQYPGNFVLMLGGNQKTHSDKVIEFLDKEKVNLNVSYLIFEKVLNASERDYQIWKSTIEELLAVKGFVDISPYFFLRVIFTVFRQDSIQDVLAESNIRVFKELYLVLNNAKKTVSDWKNLNYDISNSYDKELMYKLSLANYQIFRSCTSFNPKIFYDYILDIAKFLDKNYSEISENILYLASTVLKESLDRLNLSEVNYD